MTDKTSYRPGEPSWVDLGSPDLEASKAFYGGLFGWEAATTDDPAAGGYTMLMKDAKVIGGLGPLMGEGQPAWSMYVNVEDADKTAALIAERGGQVFLAPMDVMDVGRMAVFADPTGVAFSVWQPQTHRGAQVVDDEGTLAWVELSSRDQEAAAAFYADVFGWGRKVAEGYSEFQLGDTSVAGCIAVPDMVPAQVPGYWMPYFAAADVDGQAARAASLGATLLVPGMDFGGGRFAVVQDPQGAVFGLLNLQH